MKKCIYCKTDVDENSVIDFCSRCGISVWGEKMFNTIVKNMEDARERGDLCSTNMNGGVTKAPSNTAPNEFQPNQESQGFTSF